MHACGHDAHMACLLGVAALLAEDERAGALSFRVRLIFQPGEEGHYGARGLIEAGALEGVAAIAAGHVGDLSRELAPGQAGFLHGPLMAAADRFEGAFVGSGGHGSAPDLSPDPISAFAEYVMALNAFRSRELDQSRPAVVSVCAVSSGSTHNVIPERADFKGTARSLHPDIRAAQARRIGEIGEAVALMRALRFEYRWEEGYPPLVNDVRASCAGMRAAAAVLGEAAVVALSRPIMGGEDFSYYLERVPGFFWFLNTQAPDRGIVHPNHNPRFDLDESRLPAFVAVMASTARALAEEFGRKP
ncbi:MAG: amidohydrolase, partial [Spirochaetaceae bacterium]|nr:amidohydrolase [Spirochaetaceae bacterium]